MAPEVVVPIGASGVQPLASSVATDSSRAAIAGTGTDASLVCLAPTPTLASTEEQLGVMAALGMSNETPRIDAGEAGGTG